MTNSTREKTQSTIFFIPRLSEYAEAISRVMRELKNIGASPGQIISLLKNEQTPTDEPDNMAIAKPMEAAAMDAWLTAGYCKPREYPYTAQQIARKLGIYSMYGKPHAHAVSAMLGCKLRIGDEHKEERLLFATKKFEVYYTLYDEYAFQSVRNWIAIYGMPSEVDGFRYTYHVRCRRD